MNLSRENGATPEGVVQRSHPRAELGAAAVVSAEQWTWQGEVQNVGIGGAFVATDMPSPVLSQGIRLEFRLPCGPSLSLCATVKWIRAEASPQGPRGVGVQFVGVGRAEENVLAGYVAAARSRDAGADSIHAKVAERFSVEMEGDAIRIKMCGVLKEEDSRELLARIREQLPQAGSGKLLTYIDATRLFPCPDESLHCIKEWFAGFLKHQPFYAVAVIRNAVAMLQLRRLAREVGIAESMACFDDEVDAMAFWREIRSEQAAA